MTISNWISNNFIEIFGAVTGIIYVFLEIRQTIWLWPVGIITSAVYIWVFFTSKFYADMSLQGYYLVISILGWYWWAKGTGQKKEGGEGEKGEERRGEGTITGNQVKTPDRHSTGYRVCSVIYSYVVCSYQADRFSGSGQGFIYYFIVNSCNMDAGKENIMNTGIYGLL